MRRKRLNQQEWQKRDAQEQSYMRHIALTLSQCHPDVQEVSIRYRRKSSSFEGAEDPKWIEWKLSPNDKFYINVSCINGTCVGGGLNLTGDAREVIRKKESSVTGKSVCQGWEDAERAGRFHCLAEIEYEIIIEYSQQPYD